MNDASVKSDTESTALITALHWIYDQVNNTIFDGTEIVSENCEDSIDAWIAIACTSAGTTGFVLNIGGILTLPIALPANMVGVAGIQLRLIREIAECRGYDVSSEKVRSVALACLVGSAAVDILKDAGIQISVKLGQQAINQIGAQTLVRINQSVGFRLLTKAGEQGIVNLTKFVPFLGGLVGGTLDALSTRAVGEVAKQLFPRIEHDKSTSTTTGSA